MKEKKEVSNKPKTNTKKPNFWNILLMHLWDLNSKMQDEEAHQDVSTSKIRLD